MSDYLLPLGMVLLGIVGMTIYVLTIALRDAFRRIAAMNEKLMIILGTREGGGEAARALVASSRKPRADTLGVAGKPKKKAEPDGLRLIVGAR